MRWQIVQPHYIVDVPGRVIIESDSIRDDLLARGAVWWSLDHTDQRSWRLANPESIIEDLGGLITKYYDNLQNIIYIDDSGIAMLDPDQSYRVLLKHSTCLDQADIKLRFPYQFGYRWLQDLDVQHTISPTLLMSDVF